MPAKRLSGNKESEVFEPNFLTSKSSRKGELLANLKLLHENLSSLSQDPMSRPKGLPGTAAQIVSDRIMGNADKEVRLMAACCLVDILRVFAPEAPYDDAELVNVFALLIAQIRGFATHDSTTSTGQKIFYIINSLSVVKSCVVVVFLAQSGLPGADELYVSLFNAIIQSARAEHSEDVLAHMAGILQACIEESDVIDQDVLDALLQPLLPANKIENPTAYNLCFSVIRRTVGSLQGPISTFINNVLVGTAVHSEKESSELADDIYPLIFELHKISADLLLRILPNICVQLQVDDEEVRLKAVKLLGRLFASQLAEYGTEFSKNFRDFLGRFVDVSVAVRLEMIDNAALILKKKPSLVESVQEGVMKRLRDVESDVRLRALTRLVEVATEDPRKLSSETFLEMIERAKDKKSEIRLGALNGMCRLYCKHISSLLPPISQDFSPSSIVPKDIWGRLGTVPSTLLNSWGYPDVSSKHLILQLLQEQIIPKTSNSTDLSPDSSDAGQPDKRNSDLSSSIINSDNDSQRASALLLLFSSLEDSERHALGGILHMKMKVRADLSAYFNERSQGNSEEVQSRVRRSLFKLSTTLPPISDKKSAILDKLLSVKDKHVFSRLDTALSSASTIQYNCVMRDEARARVESRSPLGEYLGLVYDFAGSMVVNTASMKAMILYASESSASDYKLVASFAMLIVKYFPHIIGDCAIELNSWLTTAISDANRYSSARSTLVDILSIVDRAANSLASVGKQQAGSRVAGNSRKSNGDRTDSTATKDLFDLLLSESLRQRDAILCERFAQAASSLVTGGDNEDLNNAVSTLLNRKKLALDNDRLVNDMAALLKLISSSKILNESALMKVSEFVKVKILQGDEKFPAERSSKSSSRSSFASTVTPLNIACQGIKCWSTILILVLTKGTSTLDDKTVQFYCDELLPILFESLESRGKTLGNLDFGSEQTLVRETVACALFDTLRVSYVSKTLSPEKWHKLGWTLLEENTPILQKISQTYNQIIQTTAVHIRFVALSSLLFVDDRCAQPAKIPLIFALKRLRASHEDLIGRAMANEDKNLIAQAEDVIPERILPYVLHLLAHYPSGSDSSAERNKKVVKSIRLILSSLKESLRSDSDNLSYLIQQVNLLSRRFKDRLSSSNKSLALVTQMAGELLKEEIRTVENAQPYRGRINIPAELFDISESGFDVVANEDHAIEKAMRGAPKVKATTALNSQVELASKKKSTFPRKTEKYDESSDDSDTDKVVVRASNRPLRAVAQKPMSYKEKPESDRETAIWDTEVVKVDKKGTISSSSRDSSMEIANTTSNGARKVFSDRKRSEDNKKREFEHNDASDETPEKKPKQSTAKGQQQGSMKIQAKNAKKISKKTTRQMPIQSFFENVSDD